MAYNAVAQHEIHGVGSDASASPPPPDSKFRPISMEFDNMGGQDFLEDAKPAEESSTGRLASLLRSVASTGTSYDIVEEDDYNVARDWTELPRTKRTDDASGPEDYTQQHSYYSPEPMIRTASNRHPLHLRHPTPDLQSLQGAYVGNVERLEESAERLSMNSNMEEELRKMKLEQKVPARQFSAPVGNGGFSPVLRQSSARSFSSSIVGVNTAARAGGYSPGGYITSPKGSILSQNSVRGRAASGTSRLAPLPEPVQEGRPLDSPVTTAPSLSAPQPPPHAHFDGPQDRQAAPLQPPPLHNAAQDAPEERPSTSASLDTYRQATGLFMDFDGVHYTPHSQAAVDRRVSLHNPLAQRPQSHIQPPPGEDMVYYPAPVPMMLNLPQRLSKAPTAAERDKRRTQVLSSVPPDARKSAAWLGGVTEEELEGADDPRKTLRQSSNNVAGVPPQLRASAFFDAPSTRQDIEVLQGSAVATLDSILDASAYVPVSAFTDHPIVGNVRREVYGRPAQRMSSIPIDEKKITLEERKKRRSSLGTLLRRSSSGLLTVSKSRIASRESKAEEDAEQTEAEAAQNSAEGTPLRLSRNYEAPEESILPDGDEFDEEAEEGEREMGEENREEDDELNGPPTTLLAELQMRKQQQKLRNRTAATAFPNGMHSTLLQLDAVAQVQKKTRKQKHITLAWEDPAMIGQGGVDDDDVPLGMLFPGKRTVEDRPVGLVAKREMEDNEPLSKRRARLREDVPTMQGPSPVKRSTTTSFLDLPGLTDDQEREGETLAQRTRRLKAQGGTARGLESGDFTNEVLSQLGGPVQEAPKSKTPDAEETLGQRRKRLQAESKSREVSGGDGQNATLKPRRSMADISQAHPAAGARKPSNEPNGQLGAAAEQRPSQFARQSSNPLMYNGYPTGVTPSGLPSYPSFGSGQWAAGYNYGSPQVYSPAMMSGFGPATWANESMLAQGPPIDPKQRDMIDRWRQSVMH